MNNMKAKKQRRLEHLKPEGRDRRPSSARLAGPGDGSLLVPHNETSRASSPSSNGHRAFGLTDERSGFSVFRLCLFAYFI